MNLTNQCCTIRQSIRLKELGVRGESTFQSNDDGAIQMGPMRHKRWNVAELGIMMPTGFDTMRLSISPKRELWRVYDDDGRDVFGEDLFSNEAIARAALVIHLLESGRITDAQIYHRLNQS